MFSKRLQSPLIAALLFLAFPGARAEVITFNGVKVYNDAVIAKLKAPEAGSNQLRALSAPAGKVGPVGKLVPGLIVIEREEGADLGALSAEQKEGELRAWIQELEATGLFEYVEPNFQYKLALAPNDAAFVNGSLWGLHNFGQSGGATGVDINAQAAWDVTTGSSDVVVAVIDSGIRYTHQDLAAQMWINPTEVPGNGADDDNDGFIDNIYGMDAFNNDGDPTDDNGHGTHVAGTIGAAANDGNPHVGVAWNVRLMALKASDAEGNLPGLATVRAVDFAVQAGANIINASYGGYGRSQAAFDTILAARNAGVLFVAAAGNDRNDNDRFPFYPASYELDNIISVAAIDRVERLADFSNYGATSVHVAAPGVEIFSSHHESDDDYQTMQGTSMAAPHVSGIAALVFSYLDVPTYSEVRSRITNGVVSVPSLINRVSTEGRVDAFRALTRGVDGVMEVSIVPGPDSQITIGTNIALQVTVTDGLPVTNATVQMTGGGTNIMFVNNATPPDAVAEDESYGAYFFVPNTPGPITFNLTVTAPGKTNYSQTITYEAVNRPENDLFGRATKVPPAGRVYDQSTRFATMEPGEPRHAGVQTVDASVWFTWSLPEARDVIVDTAGSSFNTVVAVYTGSALESLTEIVAADDVGEKRQAYVMFRAQAATSYRIAIAGTSSDQAGELRVRFEVNGEPDSIPPIISITSPPSGFTVHEDRIAVSGTAFDPEPNASGVRDVIVRVNDQIGVGAAGTTNWVITNLLQLGINTIRATAFDFAENESAEDAITIIYRPAETENDLFGRSLPLAGNSGTIFGSNVGTQKEFLEPNHAGNSGGSSIWYTLSPTEDGVLFLSTAGSSFDTLLAVYSGTRVTNLTLLASNDDIPGGSTHSEVTLGVRAGQTYHIVVDGFDASEGEVVLNYNLNTTATFPLTATSTEGGTVSPGTGLFPVNATVSVTATPDPYWEFSSFRTPGGAIVSDQNPLTIVIQSATNLVAHFAPRQFTDDFETGALNKLPYQVNGWIVAGRGEGSTGQFAARTTATRDQHRITNSLVVITNLLQGIGSFEYRVSSETNYDRLEFYVDDVLRAQWSGEAGWDTFEFEIARSGLQRLEWRYVKDAALSGGLDAAFIDNLDLPIGILPSDPPAVGISLAGVARQITVQGAPQQSMVLQRSTDLENWTDVAVLTGDSTGSASYVDSSTSDRGFYRVRLP